MAAKTAQTSLASRANAWIMLAATVGVAVLVNALALQTSARVDLTGQKIHTLSDASITAARALDDVTVTVYISKKLPDTIPTPQGKVLLRGVDRAFRDKLSEYARASQGHVRLAFAEDNSPGVGTIEEQAEAAKLEPFSSSEAEVSGGQLKFSRFVIGATFHYKTVSEVMPKALQPGFYEFEITKILLRLKEKYDNSQLMKDPLARGKAVFEGVKACNDAVQKAAKVDKVADDSAGLSLKGSNDPGKKRIDALRAHKAELDKTCGAVATLLASEGAGLKGKNQFGDDLLQSAEQFSRVYEELTKMLPEGAEPAKGQLPPAVAIPQLVQMLDQFYKEVDRGHTTLTDSPGRHQIGFLCGHDEFCPFAEQEPFVQQEMAMMLAQNNPMMKQIVQAATQIAQAVDETNQRIGDSLFTKRGFSIKRLGPDEAIPADISAVIVYAPRKPLSEFARYQLDQVLLSGRPVVMFAQSWEVELMNMAAPDDVGNDMRTDRTAITATGSNLAEVLKPYGVELKSDMVLDSTHVETVKVMQLMNRGGLQFQTEREFPYAAIPVAIDFDRGHALTRSIQNLALPYTTSVEADKTLKNDKRFEVVDVVQSSKSSLAKAAPLPVLPPALKELVLRTPPNGPHTLALYVRGPFKSAFAGKEIPRKPVVHKDDKDPANAEKDKEADAAFEAEKRKFKAEGTGKLLVVASNLGIEGLSRSAILTGFDLSKLQQFSGDTIKNYQQWQANFQNWQIRIGQISHLLGDNLQFLANVLDWATSHEALVAIRSKGDTRRPMDQIEPELARKLRLLTLVGMPLLFIGAGLLRWRLRSRRFANLKV